MPNLAKLLRSRRGETLLETVLSLALLGILMVAFTTMILTAVRMNQQASREEIEILSRFVNKKIKDIGREIYRGDIKVSPYRMKEKTGCDHCPYHSICGFDGKVPGYSYRRLKEEKDSEVLMEQMREEVSHGDDVYGGTTEGH